MLALPGPLSGVEIAMPGSFRFSLPVDGQAKEAIIRLIADLTRLRTCAIRIISEQTSNLKLVEADGLDLAALERAILESHGPRPHTGSPSPPAA